MSEGIAMIIGFGMGAACAVCAISVVLSQVCNCREKKKEIRAEDVASCEGLKAIEREQLQKQWENFLNYDGTAKGQVEIGDEE